MSYLLDHSFHYSILVTVWVVVMQFGAVFAGAQKNVGCAGVTVVIVRSDLLDYPLPVTPTVWNFAKQSANKSRVNTPPTFAFVALPLSLKL